MIHFVYVIFFILIICSMYEDYLLFYSHYLFNVRGLFIVKSIFIMWNFVSKFVYGAKCCRDTMIAPFKIGIFKLNELLKSLAFNHSYFVSKESYFENICGIIVQDKSCIRGCFPIKRLSLVI
jgi:hypothetical protein